MDYTIVHEGLVTEIPATSLRKEKMIAWLRCLIHPLTVIYNDFYLVKQKFDVEVNYNSETMLFEHVLNNYFDNDLRRIYIDNSSGGGGVYTSAALQSEARPRVMAYLQSEGFEKLAANLFSEYAAVDFIVYIPNAITAQVSAIDRMVRKYKFAGKSYEIIAY